MPAENMTQTDAEIITRMRGALVDAARLFDEMANQAGRSSMECAGTGNETMRAFHDGRESAYKVAANAIRSRIEMELGGMS